MKTWDITEIIELVLEAGRIALHHFESPQTVQKPDRSLVTVADNAIEEFLTGHLAPDTETGVSLLGEETVGVATAATIKNALSGLTWVVDPIDGTSSYANRLPTWGISLGRMEAGRITDGVLFLPRTGDLLITDGPAVLYQQGSRNPAAWRFDDLRPLEVPDRPYDPTGMVSLPHEIAQGGRFDGANPLQASGSAVYSVAQLVLGGYLAYVARIKLWDMAGSVPILRRLGFLIQFPNGRELGDVVTDQDWVLDPIDPRIWRSSEVWFIARNQDTIDYIRTHYHPATGKR